MAQVTWSLLSCDDAMGGMLLTESGREELATKHLKVIAHWQSFRLMV